MKQLSKNFDLSEFLKSQSASRLGFEEQFDPPPQVIENLQALVDNVLQPLRDILSGTIAITSGYRCPRVNESIGGKPTSQHLLGQAADCEYYEDGKEMNMKLFDALLKSGLAFDQVIKEYGTERNPAWIHISFKLNGKNRKQILTIV